MKLFKDTYPALAKYWHVDNEKDFNTVPLSSRYVAKWFCENNHVWLTRVSNISGRYPKNITEPPCPVCLNRQLLTGFNDLATVNPEIAAQWHPTKNNELTPDKVLAGSRTKVWWQCDKGHEWETSIVNRKQGTGCPVCYKSSFQKTTTPKKKKPKVPLSPTLLNQWHPTKNGDLNPETLSAGSGLSCWWVCDKGHEWAVSPNKRTFYNTGCPVCSGTKVLPGFNDLATTHPEIASQWHPTKNPDDEPTQYTAGSGKKVWWLCSNSHSWSMPIFKRTEGQNCPICANQQILVGKNDLQTTHPHLTKEWGKTNTITPTEVVAGSDKKVFWCCSNEPNHTWYAQVRSRALEGTRCPYCAGSSGEQNLRDYLISLGLNIEANTRKIIPPFELDIYIPEKNIAIEFNGLYWHSEEQGKTKYYHHDKWEACKEKGIQLIQIWEDDWVKHQQLVSKMLAHKLGVSSQPKIYARSTTILPITQPLTNEFLNENHIQGAVNGGIRLGLFEKNTENLVAVMVLKWEPKENKLNLLRYATSANVIGGFTKIIKYVETTYNPLSIITFSDNMVSDGGLYSNNGFTAVKELAPDYMYVVGNTRIHKFNYRLKKFRNDPSLKYVEGLTERELAALNNIPRIWDAGKIKWERLV